MSILEESPIVWTGPHGPKQLAIPVPVEALHKEIWTAARTMPMWAALTFHLPGGGQWPAHWKAFSLQGYGGHPANVHGPGTWRFREAMGRKGALPIPAPDPSAVVRTSEAHHFPACLAVADLIPGRSERIRINELGAGSILPKHRDPLHEPRWEDRRVVRFHVPVIVPAGCVFFAWDRGGQAHQICERGSVWFVDTDWDHMAVNGSHHERYHLVVDKWLDDELRALLMA